MTLGGGSNLAQEGGGVRGHDVELRTDSAAAKNYG